MSAINCALSLFLLTALSTLHAIPIPGKFYSYDIVAKAGQVSLTGMGTQPSISPFGTVAFVGQYGGGETVWVGDGSADPINITPGQFNPGRVLFGQAVQINSAGQVVAQDRIPGSIAAPSSNIRIWDSTTTDSSSYVARGGTGRAYDAIFAVPSINKTGNVAGAGLLGVGRYVIAGSSAGVSADRAITGGAPQPVISDLGTIAMRIGTSTFTIALFPANLGSPTTIANSTYFTSLDNAVGISPDGRIVAFKGDLNAAGASAIGSQPGPGIFASIDEGSGRKIVRITGTQVEDNSASGGNKDGVCDTSEVCKPAAELGYDDLDSPISIKSYRADTRIAVTNMELGRPGIDDDTFIITFVATPSGASKTNPALPGKPLLFSGQEGLWSIRVDVKNELQPTFQRVYRPYTPLPVVQIGDKIAGQTITDIGFGLGLADAGRTDANVLRTMRRGDHRIAFWANTAAGGMVVRASHLDSDQDGLLDFWETIGIDMDQDGIVDLDLKAMGADVNNRDLFLEMDQLADGPGFNFNLAPGVISPIPGTSTMSPLESMFANAPALSGANYGARLDGSTPIDIKAGIRLHVDAGSGRDALGLPLSINMGAGPLDGGDKMGTPGSSTLFPEILYFGKPRSVSVTGLRAASFQELKDSFFGQKDKRAREFAFRYGVMANLVFSHALVDAAGQPFSANITSASSLTSFQASKVIPFDVARKIVKMTSGQNAGRFVRISAKATDGATGNTILDLDSALPFLPAAGDTFVILEGYSGLAEVAFRSSPDNNSYPGNDFMVTFGGFTRNATPYLGSTCMQWRTLAHEMGHTLGLRHGGTDHEQHKGLNYLSLMSYSHQLKCLTLSPVQSYSGSADPTFFDFGDLQLNAFNSMIHLGSSLNTRFGAGDSAAQFLQLAEPTLFDYETLNGPIDTVAPVVTITAPAAVTVGAAATVTATVTDNVSVSSVTISFDANGNGVFDPTEILPGVLLGPNQYSATFSSVAGAAGVRAVQVFGMDPTTNIGVANGTITASTTAAAADLGIALSTTGAAVAGQSLTYQMVVTNGGPSAATAVTATLTLPAGVTFVSATAGCTGTGPVVCTVANLANAANAAFQIVVTPAAAGTLNSSATVTGSPADPNTANNNAALATTITAAAAADLAIALTTTGSAVAGQNLTYQMVATNNGPSVATAVTATLTLPAGVTFVSATAGCTGTGPVVCTVANLANAANAAFQIVVTPAAAGTINSSATVTGSPGDPNTANNNAALATTITAAAAADLGIALSTTGAAVAGQSLTYQVVVTNGGPSAATAITATLTLPAGVTFVSATAGCTGTGPITCTAATLANAATATFQIVVTPAAAGTLNSSATVTGSPGDPNTANNNAALATTTITAAAAADLAIALTTTGSAVAGQNLTYQMVATNNGPSVATAVTATFTLPAGVTFVSATAGCTGTGPITCTAATLANAATATYQIVVTPTAAGILNSSVTVTGTPADPDTANNSAALSTTVTAAAAADLAIALSTTGAAVAGQTLTYQMTVTNNGPSAATAITATFTPPTGATFVSATAGCTGAGPIVCTAATLANAVTATFQVVVTPTAAGTLNSSATVTGSPTDPNTANNSTALSLTVIGTSDRSISLNTTGPAVAGQLITYQMTVSNSGTIAATGVTVTLTLPSGVNFVSASPSCFGVGPVVCIAGTLAVGGVATFQVSVLPLVEGALNASAKVTGSPADSNTSNDTAVLLTAGAPAPAPRIITPIHLPAVTIGAPIGIHFTAAGGVGPYLWSVPGPLPTGMSLSPSGVLTGRITRVGPIYFPVSVTDANHKSSIENFALQIVPATP